MFIALYDACVLYGNVGRDFLIRVAIHGTVVARWTDEILDEVFGNLTTNRPDLDSDKLTATRAAMCGAIPDVLVNGYDGLADAFDLPDPNDRHVLAAAIRCGAQVIVTENVRDFPGAVMGRLGIEVRTTDDFLVDQYYLDPEVLVRIASEIAETWTQSRGVPQTSTDVADSLEHSGLLQLAELLRSHLS